jgi:prevent-host-death family protein
MRPAPKEITDEIYRGWWAEVDAMRDKMTMVGDHGDSVSPVEERVVAAGQFKARCLALLDEVAGRRTEIVVTKRGVPVARVVPVSLAPSTDGSVTLLASEDEAYFSTGESWDADR